MLNSDRVEVSPEFREKAWKDLIISTVQNVSDDNTYRTCINKATIETFDYKRPLVYEIKNKTVLINNDFLNKALNRPSHSTSPIRMNSLQIFLSFIGLVLITIILSFLYSDDDIKIWQTIQ